MELAVKRQFVYWLTLTRLGAVARGVLPHFLGTVIAWSQGYAIDLPIFSISAVAVISIMVMTFLFNEYFDYETDSINKDYHKLSGGSRILVLGLASRRQALYGAYAFFGLSVVLGLILYFYFHTGPLTIPLGALAILIGYFYTARPVKLAYRGFGELAIWFTCGWLSTILGYYLQTGVMNTTATLVSLPGALSVFLVILMNEVPDIASDSVSGKRNLAVLLGKHRTFILYSVLLVLCLVNILAIIPFGAPWTSGLFSAVLVPIIVLNLRDIRKKDLSDNRTLETLSLRTMLLDHLITFIYSAVFIIAGIALVGVSTSLIVIILSYLAVFALEGISIQCASMVER